MKSLSLLDLYVQCLLFSAPLLQKFHSRQLFTLIIPIIPLDIPPHKPKSPFFNLKLTRPTFYHDFSFRQPYWMAPEIIEMHGATTTSDIWSVGCTIIELVTGNPPYFELDAMPALFRIVQDDSPPIPDNISPLLRDFLMTCFQKEPLLRSSAEMLLKHRWLTTTMKKPDLGHKLTPSAVVPQAQVEDWNKKMEAKREEMKKAAPAETSKKSKSGKKRTPRAPQPIESSSSDDEMDDYGGTFDIKSFAFPGTKKDSGSAVSAGKASASSSKTSTLGSSASSKPAAKPKKDDSDEEDWDDMGFDDVAPTKLTLPKAATDKPKATSTSTGKTAKPAAKDDEDDWDDMEFGAPSTATAPAATPARKKSTGSGGKAKTPRKSADDDDNWDDLGSPLGASKNTSSSSHAASGGASGASGGMDLAQKLAQKLKTAYVQDDTDMDNLDLFDEVEESSDMDLNDDLVIEKTQAAHIASSAIRSIESLNSFASEESILAHLEGIMNVFKDYPQEKSHIIARTGVIPFVEMLQMSSVKEVVLATLKIINVIVEDGPIRESFSVMGGIASTLQYANRKYPRPIRQEASVFIRQMLSAGRKTMQMFIGAHGLPVLVDFIEHAEDFVQNKDLYLIGIDCIYSILTSNLQIRIPKNDFCRLFAKLSLLPRLACAFELVVKDPATKNIYADKIADIFLIFSKGDTVVKTHFCEDHKPSAHSTSSSKDKDTKDKDREPYVLRSLLNVLSEVSPSIFLKVLKCISALSMSSNTLDRLASAGAIKTLVPYMGRREGSLMMETHQQLFSALYNLCRLNPGRQLVAAKAGIIPHLQWVIQENHPLKQFALPTLFEMARVQKIRDMMKPPEGVLFFISLMRQHYPWQTHALDCLANWLKDKNPLVAETIQNNLDPIIEAFRSSISEAYLHLFEHLLAIITTSDTLNVALGTSPIIESVIERTNNKNVLLRVLSLRIIDAFLDKHPKPLLFVAQLQETVSKLKNDPTILVRNLAVAISLRFKRTLKSGVVPARTKDKDTARSSKALSSAISSEKDKEKRSHADSSSSKDKEKDKKEKEKEKSKK